MKQELLAPAGDIEAGYAAFYYGADAVYLGLQQFSARATATNFDEPSLNELTGYAHSLGRKVYVAINTLVQEAELGDLMKSLDICVRCHVDALIIQDLGVAGIVRKVYPELELHASTQMAVHNKEGALALQKAGFSRVVLARELSLSEIKEIAAIPGLETEAFIHGALCYSYSGLCLFSSMENGRSANRGKCLYPCRSLFRGEAGEKHYFSMKDMALGEDVIRMPVTSLKVEGRKKTALYVAAVTDYYRKILDGKGADKTSEDNIRQIFSRPWCKFHFRGRDKDIIDRDFVGHRGLVIGKVENVDKGWLRFRTGHAVSRYDGIQLDVAGQEKPFGFSVQVLRVNGRNVFEVHAGETAEIKLPPQTPALQRGQTVYLASSGAVKGEYRYERPKPGAFKQRREIDIRVDIGANAVTARGDGVEVSVQGSFAAAENPQKVETAVRTAFEKCGNADKKPGRIEVSNPDGLFVPVSVLNHLRRELYEASGDGNVSRCLPETEHRMHGGGKMLLKTDRPESLTLINFDDCEEIIVLLDENFDEKRLKGLPHHKLRLALPAVSRKAEVWAKLINRLLAQGYRKWEIANYWGLSVLPEKGIDLSFDYPLYVFNTQAAQTAAELGASRVTLSVEDSLSNWQKLAQKSPLPVVLPIYEDVPLFRSAVCIRSNACKDCPHGEKWLELKQGSRVYDVLSRNCFTMLFDREPFCAAAEAAEVPADFYRVDILYKKYTPEQAAHIWQKACLRQDVCPCRKGNLYRNGGF